MARSAGIFAKAFRKLATKVTLADGTIMYFEMMDHKDFVNRIKEFQEGK